MAMKRAAVVIGVNKTGGLPVLQGSAAGAEAVRAWLEKEGFDVQTFTDVDDKGVPKDVTAQMLKAAVKKIVGKGTYSQLVIFFSGHGYWKNDNEFWLLSGAPEDSEEAISWTETAELAKGCGIPNVVLISDACRTMPATPAAMRIRGSVLIPNVDQSGPRSRVDKYLAAVITNPAYELKLVGDDKKTSVFTYCLLDAFREPDADTVENVTQNGEQLSVVPNRKLAISLQRRVPEVLQSVNATYEQIPDAEVLSDDDAYIARAGKIRTPSPGDRGTRPAVLTMKEIIHSKIWQKLDPPPKPGLGTKTIDPIERAARDSGFDDLVAEAIPPDTVRSFESQCGLTVRGTAIEEIAAGSGARAEILDTGDGRRPGVVRLHLSSGVSSIGIRFRNGRGTVVAALSGYIGHLQINGSAVVGLSYVPSENNYRWYPYSSRRQTIEDLRAITAAAVRRGVFRLSNKEKARTFARAARTDKALDPTLGIYSTYAYWQADDRDAIASVLEYMREDLGAWVFDVALLADAWHRTKGRAPPVAPFCPMLTQGWNLLRLRDIELPGVLAEAQDELEDALWTTFKPARAKKIMTAMKRGDLV